MAKRNIIKTPIPNMATPWDNGVDSYSGEMVEQFIKEQLRSKMGAFFIDTTNSPYLTLLFFESEQDKNLWLSDKQREELVKDKQTIRLTVTDDSSLLTRYISKLVVEKNASSDIITTTGNIILGVRFSAIQSSAEGRMNANIDGTLEIERSTDNGTSWQAVGSVRLTSRDELSDRYDNVDISKYIVSGAQRIRMRATYAVNDESATQTSAVSGWIVYNINHIQIGLEYAGDPTKAWDTTDNTLLFEYRLMGDVDRTLHINVTGEYGTRELTYFVPSSANTNYLSVWNNTAHIAIDTEGLLTHGVKTIEAWLTCSDGETADAISTEHVVSQRMVDVDNSDLVPRLLLENLKRNVVNYVQTTLFSYVLYGTERKSVVVRLTDYDGGVEYFRMENVAEPNMTYHVPATIEIEDAVNDTIHAYLHIADSDGTSLAMTETITVNNTDKFAPTLGADFLLNPKTRNNSESNPDTIINAMTGKVVGSEFVGFGGAGSRWVEENGIKLLRVLAGQQIVIDYDWLKAFRTNNRANVTIEFDYKVSNVTDEDLPILTASEDYGGSFIGFQLKPMELITYTKNKKAYQEQNLMLAEDVRTHVSINIVSALRATTEAGAKALPLCRIFVNGVVNREFMFDTDNKDWYNAGSKIVIGQQHADIDIYSLRVYDKELSSADVLNNYTATLPTAEEKVSFRNANAILNSATNLIDLNKSRESGKNTLVWHGAQPYFYNQAKQKGYLEVNIYKENGELDKEHSGTICKQTKSLTVSGQGTTAKTYYYWNWALKLKDIKELISVPLTNIHKDMVVSEPLIDEATGTQYVTIYGCGLGKNDWANDKNILKKGAQKYEYANGVVQVPDGWVDGNGVYRGRAFKLSAESGYVSKMQNKINYASAMQSHLMGANDSYHDLHTAVVGNVGIQKDNKEARLCKEMIPFLYFTQDGDNSATYQGGCTFGGAKMDDATMGYDKKQYPNFCMLEGADNNLTLTDFRTPWISKYITYDIKDGEAEGYSFNSNTSFDLDRFAAIEKNVNGSVIEAPNEFVEQKIKELVNFLYLHSTRIKVFVGDYNRFVNSESAKDITYKWFVTSGAEALKLKRYDEVEKQWVDAGWNEATEEATVIDLKTQYVSVYSRYNGKWEQFVTALKVAIANEAKAKIGTIIDPESLRFHYNYVNRLLAGTDNCSKNTYYCLVPDGKGGWIWILTQDDMDTILATDNSGYQNKPYYIERLYPTADYAPDTSLYQGDANVLFDLAEAMYEESGENREMMKRIFAAMCRLAPKSNPTLWGFFEKYFFGVQQYFPAVAYNEQARIRYEYPTSLNYISSRGVNPITQSCGDQLLAEEQYMKRRLVYFASYAAWGDFEQQATGNVGVDGTSDVLGIQGNAGKSHNIVFKGLVPHQYMYIGGYVGTTTKSMGVRCAPNKSYDFDLTGTTPATGDTACALFGINFFRSIGDIGGLSITSQWGFVLNAKRLTDVTITANGVTDFLPPSLTLNTPLVERVNLQGSGGIGGNLNLSNCIRLRSVNTEDSGVQDVILPQNKLLTSVQLGMNTLNLSVGDFTILDTFTMQSYDKLVSVSIGKAYSTTTLDFVNTLYRIKPKDLRSLSFGTVDWSDISVDVLMWMVGMMSKDSLTGVVRTQTGGNSRSITLAEKTVLAEKFGNIDEKTNGLYVVYPKKAINSVVIYGKNYPYQRGEHSYELITTPADGNDVAVLADGSLNMEWGFQQNNSWGHFADKKKGILTVTGNSEEEVTNKRTMTLKVTKTDGSVRTASKAIGFYRRIPQVGDFAYGNGDFDDVYDTAKDLMGMVLIKLPIKDDDNIVGYDLRIISHKQLWGMKTSGGVTYNYLTYGIGGLFSQTEQKDINIAMQVADCKDTLLPNFDTIDNITFNNNTNETNYYNDTKEGGYAELTPNTAGTDFNGKENTRVIKEWATKVAENYLGIEMPTDWQKFIDTMHELRQGDNTNASLYRTGLLYPVYVLTTLYEPTAKHELDVAYRKGEWYVASMGEWLRVHGVYFAEHLCNQTPTFNAPTIAKTPLFSNANHRAGIKLFNYERYDIFNDAATSTEANANNFWHGRTNIREHQIINNNKNPANQKSQQGNVTPFAQYKYML